MTEAERQKMEAYRRRNPWTVHDTNNVGRGTSRYPSLEAARAEYGSYEVGVNWSRKQLLVSMPVYC